MTERESMPYDVVIVGAGPAGLSAAIRLKQLANAAGTELAVCVLEKGSEVGAHILSGAVIDPRGMDELIPDWRDTDCPLAATPVTQNHHWVLTATKKYNLPHWWTPPFLHNKGTYTCSLGNLCRWLAGRAEELGVEIFPGFAAAEILFDDQGRVKGVATGDMGVARDGTHKGDWQPGLELHAKYTFFAEGVRGHLTKEVIRTFDLARDAQPQVYGLGIKELWDIDPEKHEPGKVVHTQGFPLGDDANGGGWIYHQADGQVSIGFVTWLGYTNPHISPFHEMQKWKTHPAVADLLQGGKRVSYGARAINDGGLQSIPTLVFPGGALIGCSAGFLNVPRIKGTHGAQKSAMMAAEAAFAAIAAGREHDELTAYPAAFEASWLHKELSVVRNVVPLVKKFGDFLGSGLSGITMWAEHIGLKMPFTMKHHPDHESLWRADLVKPPVYPKADGVLTFDRLSSVFLSNTNHEEDQPVHLTLRDPTVPIAYNLPLYDEPAQRYCPAGVYEVVGVETDDPKFVINAQNCVHCKTCDIKDPTQNINWVVPEGGGGPIIRTCSLLAALLFGAGAAQADAGPAAGDLGAYLRARVAETAGQDGDAVASYARALAAAPRNPVIAIRAYRAALAADDVALARRAAAALTTAGVAPDDAALLPLADAAHTDDPAAATRALAAIEAGRLRILVPAVRAWIGATTGGNSLAVEAPKDEAIARRLLNETRALLLIAQGHQAEGIAAVEAIGGPIPGGLHLAAAELLYGAGQDKAAATLLGRRTGQIAAARAGATARPTLAFAVSRLFMRLADDLGGGQPTSLGMALARLATVADPDYARARLLLAEQLELDDDPDRALAELARIPADGPLGATAAGRRIDLLDRVDRAADALVAAQGRAVSADAAPVDRARYADLLVAADRPADALPFYAAIARGDDTNWAAWLRYGSALDEAGRWKDARKALRRAVALAPDQATALNYLGYAQVERGEDLAAATRLLERAHALAADDASIADSLGWAYHRGGETVRALPLLERAAVGAPANPEISEHLGDAYWTLGRRFEARYAWTAAAVTADPATTARLATKQERGL